MNEEIRLPNGVIPPKGGYVICASDKYGELMGIDETFVCSTTARKSPYCTIEGQGPADCLYEGEIMVLRYLSESYQCEVNIVLGVIEYDEQLDEWYVRKGNCKLNLKQVYKWIEQEFIIGMQNDIRIKSGGMAHDKSIHDCGSFDIAFSYDWSSEIIDESFSQFEHILKLKNGAIVYVTDRVWDKEHGGFWTQKDKDGKDLITPIPDADVECYALFRV